MDPKAPTWAQRFRDAVWEAGPDELSPTEAIVLLAYADHARGGDCAWVAQSRLMQRCKIRSSSTPSRVVADLVDKGWLVLLARAQWRNKQSPTYRLAIPKTSSLIEVVDGRKPPRSKAEPPRSKAEPPRSVARTTSMSEANHLDERVPLSSEDPRVPREGEATPPAEPGAAPPEEQDPTPLPPGEGKAAAFAAAQAARKREIRFSNWHPTRAQLAAGLDGPKPNPAYTSAHAAAVAAELPPYERPRAEGVGDE